MLEQFLGNYWQIMSFLFKSSFFINVVCFCTTVTVSEVQLVPRAHNLWTTLYITVTDVRER